MNRLLKSLLLGILASFLVVGSAMATPMYTGDTYASWGLGGTPDLPAPSGYYIWSNDAEKTSWSIRWTGNNSGGTVDDEYWMGRIEFVNNNNTSITAVLWETSGYYMDGDIIHTTSFFSEHVDYGGHAGPHWDGFDFTLTGDATAGFLRFNLGSTYYADLSEYASGNGVEATSLWVGDGNVPNVFVGEFDNGMKFQSFETPAPVPEPATIMLFGIGLLGIAGINRRKNN